MNTRSLIAFVCIVSAPAAAVSAQAQAPGPSRIQQDIEFAEKLQAYYLDLAEDFLGQIEKNPALKDEDKARIGLVRASILSRRASQQTDLKSKVETFQQSIAVIEDFLKKYPNHPAAADARARIGEIGREMGDAIIDVIRDETDPKRIEALRNQAEKTFKDAEDRFRKEIEKLANPKDDEQEKALAIARFNFPKTQYRHALLFEKGNATRNFLLKDAKKNLDEALFELGIQELPATHDASITMGLVLKEIGDWKNAKAAFLRATEFKALFEDLDNPGKYLWQDPGPYIVATAYFELCKGGNEFNDYAAVIDAAYECFKILPDLREDPLGWRILLEKAKALHQTGQGDDAQKAIDSVISRDPKGYWGRQARELVTKLLVDPESASPAQLLTAARSELSKGRGERGLNFLQSAIRRAQEKPETKKIAADAFYLMAVFFDGQGKDEEAVLAYQQVPAIEPKHANAAECIYRAATNLTQLGGSGSAYYEALYQKAVADLRSKFPDSPFTKKLELIAARRLYAKKQYAEAAKIYEAVPESSENYVEAVIWSGQCYYMIGRDMVRQAKADLAKNAFEKAVAISRKAYEKAANLAQTSQKEEDQAGFRETAFASLTRISEIYLEDAVNKPAEALKNLEGLEKTYTDQAKTSKILSLRLQALIGLNQLDDATGTLDALLKSGSNERGLSSSCRAVAARLEKDAEEREKKSKGDPRIATNLRRAAGYYEQWIEKGRANNELGRGPENYIVAADRLVAIGEKINEVNFQTVLDFEDKKIGEPGYWQSAASLYEIALKPPLRDALGQGVYLVRIKHARALAALRQWPKVVEALETLVKAESMLNPMSGRLNVNAVSQKPVLLDAYALLGFAYYLTGRDKRDNGVLNQATEVFARIQENTVADTALWWQVRYLILNVLFDQGEYQSACTVVKSITNNYPNWDQGKFGLGPRFDKLKQKIESRCP